MATFGEALDRARQLLGAGDLAQADVIYRRLIEADPQAVEPWHELGIVQLQAARPAAAVDCLRHAIALDPGRADYYASLGVAYRMLQQPLEAVAILERGLKLGPPTAELCNNLALSLKDAGRADEALRAFDDALMIRPDYANGHFNRANLLLGLGRLEEAAESYRRAIGLQPGDAFAHCKLGMVYCDLDDANPGLALVDANQAGTVSPQPSRLELAAACFRRAVELKPDYAEAYCQLAGLLATQNRLDEAVACYRRTLALDPDFADAHNNLAVVLLEQNKPGEAVIACRRSLEQKPDSAAAHTNCGVALLKLGRLVEGWPEYEWWRGNRQGLDTPQPQSLLGGRTVLLHCEQGYGDSLQFIRYAELVKQLAARVIVECPQALALLLADCPGVDSVVVAGQPLPDFDVRVPLLSLPGIFRTSLDTIPAQVPYFSCDHQAMETWKQELNEQRGFKIGIAWQGNPTQPDGRFRSFPVAHFAGIARMRAVQLYSLQWGKGREQLTAWRETSQIIDLGDRLGDFHNTAAIMRSLDLVISCDSAPAHLAGGLAVPVWIPLTFTPDWRWMLERTDSPWYPTLRLFRQFQPGDWDGVFQRIETALMELV